MDLPVHVDATVPVQDHALTLRAAARITGRVMFDGDSQPPALGELRLMPRVDHSDLTLGSGLTATRTPTSDDRG